ncbi:MAG: N-acetylmuramoyl-L-alanine amidase [Planctomycetes bacterium]|nr:N-acetylmuramoyl-L-alanine amidase [Planctomycetota bacterium]
MSLSTKPAFPLPVVLAVAAGGLAAGGLGGWLAASNWQPRPEPSVVVVSSPDIPDPLSTAPREYSWTTQPPPLFPIPPYARYLRELTIVIDPGHIGQSEKNRSANWKRGPTGLREAEVNLRVANYLREFLRDAGAKVVLTREQDVPRDISDKEDLAERAEIANRNRADLLISVHHNGADSTEANYSTVFYHGDGSKNPASLSAARYILNGINDALRLEKLTEIPLWTDLQIESRTGFGVLRRTEGPAVLCESSFHTNPAEEQRLRDPVYNRREAYGMFLGIARWAQAGLPRVSVVEPTGAVSRGRSMTLQLDDGLSKRDGNGPRALRVLGASLRIELDGRTLDYLSLNQKKGELKIVIPADAQRGATLLVDFQNIFGQHVTYPRIPLSIE